MPAESGEMTRLKLFLIGLGFVALGLGLAVVA
jgi:hypothetical protein